MKKCFLSVVILGFASLFFGKENVTGKVVLGGKALEKSEDSPEFGNAYLMSDVSGGNNYVTAGGKIYYRVSLSDDSKDLDKEKSLSQKIELKRAYVRVRPLGNQILEFSIGKLYSYYLPGNFFSLSEIYTGNSRWGKTGLGAKFENKGFTVGLALPLSESYVEFKNGFGLNGALGYDFKNLNEKIPLKVGATFIYDYSKTEVKNKPTEDVKNFGGTFSVNFSKKISEKKFNFSTTLSYSWNAEPYVASSVFKNISNYDAEGLGKTQLFSLNQTLDFSRFKIILEAEAGKSNENDWIPLYFGLQPTVKFTEEFSLRPRFFYYAALNSENNDNSRQTFEVYPRVWFEKEKWSAAAGFDFYYKQTGKDDWQGVWSIPFLLEYKF